MVLLKIVTKSILCKWQESKVILHMVKLSKRLYSVVNYIPKGSVIADIGSDHAYLPIFAIQNGYAVQAIAGEVVQGPFEAAKSSVLEVELQHVVEVRKRGWPCRN